MDGIIKDRAELDDRLRELAKTEYEGEISPGAMCYKPAAPRPVDYICPACGGATRQTNHSVWTIERARGIVEELQSLGFDALLDEREFCIHCGENAKDYPDVPEGLSLEERREFFRNREDSKPDLIFKIRFGEDDDYHVACSTLLKEYKCVLKFLSGDDLRGDGSGRVDTIRDNVKILQKMLGIGEDIQLASAPKRSGIAMIRQRFAGGGAEKRSGAEGRSDTEDRFDTED